MIGNLVKDPASELVGIITKKVGVSYEVYWFQPPGKMKLYRHWSFRDLDNLELVSEVA